MTELTHPMPDLPLVPVVGSSMRYPLRRLFCVGRNYVAHAAEMGAEVDREAPFYFTKSAFSVALSGTTLPYPTGTADYHHEVELAVALGAPAHGVSVADATDVIFGYGCALDMTRRDLQAIAKDKRRPWDLGKDVEGSGILGPLTPRDQVEALGPKAITLHVNGTVRQRATLAEMVHSVPEIIADLSRFYHLGPGDVILTGTPAGVGPVVTGDHLVGHVDGLAPLEVTIGPVGS